MKSKHRKTLQAIFENPVRANILWENIEGLFVACGAEISEGRGSRLRIALKWNACCVSSSPSTKRN